MNIHFDRLDFHKEKQPKFQADQLMKELRECILTCLTAFVQLNLDKPFCIIEIDGNTLIVGLWSDEWMEIFNQNRKLDSALCWLLQNLWRCQMADFWIQKYILDKIEKIWLICWNMESANQNLKCEVMIMLGLEAGGLTKISASYWSELHLNRFFAPSHGLWAIGQ